MAKKAEVAAAHNPPTTDAEALEMERNLRRQADAWAHYQEPRGVQEINKNKGLWIHAKAPGIHWRERMDVVLKMLLPKRRRRRL